MSTKSSTKNRSPEAQVRAKLDQLWSQHQYDKAIPLAKRALSISQRERGEWHRTTASAYNDLALLYGATRRYAEAEPLYIKAYAILLAVFVKEVPEMATVCNNLAGLYFYGHRNKEAYNHAFDALDLFRAVCGEGYKYTLEAYRNLGLLLLFTGSEEKAEQVLKIAVANSKTLGKQHAAVAVACINLAYFYEITRRYAEAERALKKALAICKKTDGEDHINTAACRQNLASLYQMANESRDGKPPDEETPSASKREPNEKPASADSTFHRMDFFYRVWRFTEFPVEKTERPGSKKEEK